MRSRDRWVLWSRSKVPLQLSGWSASSTDPATWTSYARVRGYARKGFVLGDGIGCIDLDHCLDSGVVAEWARPYLADTYVEVSPSGSGLHVFGWLAEGPGRRRGRVEVYSVGRYMTVTGRRFSKTSQLADLAAVL